MPALRVGLIGAGRAGTVVARALERVGHHCVAVTAVSDASRKRAAALLPSADVVDAVQVCERADLIIVAVPDDAIESTVRGLVAVGAITERHFVMHLSGRHGVAVLASAAEQGATVFAVHPAMTLHGQPEDVARLQHCPFAITADGDAATVASALVYELGGEPRLIGEAQRIAYHAALAHASNHSVTLVAQSMELLRSIGITDPGDFLRPLVEASVANALARGDDALTGPIARGDMHTVQSHCVALQRMGDDGVVSDDVPQAYLAMARATAARHNRQWEI